MGNKKVNWGNYPTRILVYVVINTENNEVVYKDYSGKPASERKRKLNEKNNVHITDITWVETEFSEVYDEDFIDEDEAAKLL